jgi:hypothetical protein
MPTLFSIGVRVGVGVNEMRSVRDDSGVRWCSKLSDLEARARAP